ncbi:hypothetical protein GCM10010468_50930 [Actinocorallia longicatena]|uniref:Uncharacterized protein n=1 Tax=Actinocorallia longicatena TaxID=111803 RepID=A0ABP6QF07_9ACTN
MSPCLMLGMLLSLLGGLREGGGLLSASSPTPRAAHVAEVHVKAPGQERSLAHEPDYTSYFLLSQYFLLD